MTKQELAQQVKAKYPEYQNVDDNELADKIISKYPVYQNQITETTQANTQEKPKSALRKVGDFFTGSTQKFAETIGAAASVVDPKTKKLREETLSSTNKMVDDLMARAKSEPDKEKAKKILESASKLADTENIDIFNNPEYKKTVKQIAGEAIGTGLEALSFGTYGKTAGVASKLPTIVKPLVSPAKKVLTGITEGAKIGATYGGVSGLSQSLQENKSATDIAKDTAIGAGIGGLTGGVLGGTTSGSVALLNKGIELTKNFSSKLGKFAEQKLYKTASDLVKMSPTAIQKETRFGKNTPKFITDEGILPLIEGEGNKINTEKATGALQIKYGEEANAFKSVLKDSGEYISLNDFKNKTLSELESLKTKGSDYDDAIKYINSEVNSYKSNFKDIGLVQGDDLLIPLDKFNEIKSGLWSKTNFNATQKDALFSNLNFKMGNSAKQIIEDKLTDTNAKAMNSRLGDFISAIKVLENSNGKTLPGGFFGRQFTRMAGTIAGSSGGVTGSIIGNITAGKLADIVSNPQFTTKTWYKIYSKLYKTEGGKSIIEEAQKILEKRGLERASRKLLEAPKSIPLGSKTDTSKLFTQEEAQQLLESMKIKSPQKLLKAPLGDKTNPILLQSPKGKGEILKSTQYKSALEALRSPEMKAKLKAVETQMPKKVTKTSNNLYHSTSAENLDSIIKGGLKTRQKPKFEGVSSPNKISFSANEEAAKYYGGDVMIRTKTSYKPTDLELDLLAGGNGTYLTGKNIPPEMLEIKVGGKWTPLTEYKKPLLKANNLNPLNFKTAEDYVKVRNKLYQLDKVNKLNPMADEYHTGIRTVKDINTFKEAYNNSESFVYPDFNKELANKALKDGKVTVYSSKPLDKNAAQFVTPSKMNATDYAGGKKVYSKTVSLDDIAWINGDEGQLVGNYKSQLISEWNKANKLKSTPLKSSIKPTDFATAEDYVSKKLGVKDIADKSSSDIMLGKNYKFDFGGGKIVSGDIRETPKEVFLNIIGSKNELSPTKETLKGTGIGTKVVNQLKDYADLTGKKLVVPDATNNALGYWDKIPFLKRDYGIKILDDTGKYYNPSNTYSYTPKSQLISEWNKAQPLKSSPLKNPLVEEAKKYKSADEVKNIKSFLEKKGLSVNSDNTITLYHGTSKESSNLINKQGFIKPAASDKQAYLTPFKNKAKDWAEGKGTPIIVEVKVPIDFARYLPSKGISEFIAEGGLKKVGNVWIPVKEISDDWLLRLANKRK